MLKAITSKKVVHNLSQATTGGNTFDFSKSLKKALEKRDQELSLLSAKERYFKLKSDRARVEIPVSVFEEIAQLGRRKYRVIIAVAGMSLLWDGWHDKRSRKMKRVPKQEVLYTRRMVYEWFNIPEATTERALYDLLENRYINIHEQGLYSSRRGKRLGSTYRLSWLPCPKGEHRIWLYWSLFISKPFQALSETAQAVLILLHAIHHRKRNRVTITTRALERFNIDRNIFSKAFREICHSGLVTHWDGNDYRFEWMTTNGRIDYDWIDRSSD